MKANKVLFIGGDMRQIRAVNRIAECGIETAVFGFEDTEGKKLSECVNILYDIRDIYDSYDVIILPLPYTIDGETINISGLKYKINVKDFLSKLSQKSIIFAGKSDKMIMKIAEDYELKIIDYFDREELQILNAIPTAEGAIQIAMEETSFTIHSSKCLVIGNGRIGAILSKMLNGIGADVTVAARKQKDRAKVFSLGMKSISMVELYEKISEFDIIFNTAPNLILDSDMLMKSRRSVLIIDLASKPGGVDFETARKMGIKVIWALSLPGKVAPDTAGDIIGKTILNIIEEVEVKK
ncbi:MAG: dipicolinate synthase subunit DpsA [Clostridia bacterium]|nr:dipicolinate synthase subunit DpsA [Clostridia bacterium]